MTGVGTRQSGQRDVCHVRTADHSDHVAHGNKPKWMAGTKSFMGSSTRWKTSAISSTADTSSPRLLATPDATAASELT